MRAKNPEMSEYRGTRRRKVIVAVEGQEWSGRGKGDTMGGYEWSIRGEAGVHGYTRWAWWTVILISIAWVYSVGCFYNAIGTSVTFQPGRGNCDKTVRRDRRIRVRPLLGSG